MGNDIVKFMLGIVLVIGAGVMIFITHQEGQAEEQELIATIIDKEFPNNQKVFENTTSEEVNEYFVVTEEGTVGWIKIYGNIRKDDYTYETGEIASDTSLNQIAVSTHTN